VFLARIDITARRFADARRTLTDVPSEATLGLELRAQLHYWRGVALTRLAEPGQAAAEFAAARRLVEDLRERAPRSQATAMLTRPDLAVIVDGQAP